MTFPSAHPALGRALGARGYSAPTAVQLAVLEANTAGRDLLVSAQTGSGKTVAFGLAMAPTLLGDEGRLPQAAEPLALIVAPTRELALQVQRELDWLYKETGARVVTCVGGMDARAEARQLGIGAHLVVGTPGRLRDHLERRRLDLTKLTAVVLDEADEMLNMGFIEDIEKIMAETPAERQTALFSATLPKRIRDLANRFMRDPQSVTIKRETLTVDAIEQRYYLVHEVDKTSALTRLFEVEPIRSALIFARTRAETATLANELVVRGIPAEAIHGDLDQNARERVLGRFRANQLKVLVATDVAARGLDIDDISHVFNYHLPDDAEVYIHRIGRTGRAGKTGVAITLLAPREKRRLREVEALTKQPIKKMEIPTPSEIVKHREGQVVETMKIWLGRGRFKRELEMVQELIEAGHDPLNIAAAALKIARADEKQRPIAEMGEVKDDRGRKEERGQKQYGRGGPRESTRRGELSERGVSSRRRGGDGSHEDGMVRLKLNKGKTHGVRPNDIVGTIAFHANIPGYVIGKIRIEDKFTFVDVPEDVVEQVLKQNGNYRIGKEKFALSKAQ